MSDHMIIQFIGTMIVAAGAIGFGAVFGLALYGIYKLLKKITKSIS